MCFERGLSNFHPQLFCFVDPSVFESDSGVAKFFNFEQRPTNRASRDARGSLSRSPARAYKGSPKNFVNGNFAPGDILFDTSNTARTLTLDFKQPLKSVGTQIEGNALASFVAQIQAFDHHKLLATFMESSNGNLSAGDNSAIFLGVMSPKADITSVVYSVTITGSPDTGFAINRVTISQ